MKAERNVPHALVDCGCETTVYTDGSGVEIHYCPLHEAASEMLRSLKELYEFEEGPGETDRPMMARVKAAIANAEGRS